MKILDDIKAKREAASSKMAFGEEFSFIARDRDIRDYLTRMDPRTVELMENVIRAAKSYETYLPNSEPIGAARHSEMNRAAWGLRKALEALEQGE